MVNLSWLIKIFLNIIACVYKTIIIIIFKKIYSKRNFKNPLPPVKNNYLLEPAHVLAKKIRNREISSVKLVELFIERIKEVQPLLNCVCATCFDEAIKEAEYVDDILALKDIPERYNEENSPLLGVPFSCKETMWVKGMPNTAGLVRRKNLLASEDCEVVSHMRKAGAILLCLTNISELCLWMESTNNVYGETNNAYNLSRSPGGSSGGEAALIASAASVIGVGSDIGGSIRIPCCFNGIYGHKCSNGLISIEGKHPPTTGEIKEKLNTVGPMCRYASDLRLLMKIQSGPIRFAQVKDKFNQKIDLSKLNYYYTIDLNDFKVSSLSTTSRKAVFKAVRFLENSFNIKAKPLNLRDFKKTFDMWSVMMRDGNKTSTGVAKLVMDSSNQVYNPFIELMKGILRTSDLSFSTIINGIMERIPISNAEQLVKEAFELKSKIENLLGETGIIISAGYPTVAPFHYQQMFSFYDFAYFGLYNVLGLPVTQCPMGLSRDSGLPVGIQIVSNDKCDHLTISLAEYLEEKLGGWKPPF